MIAMKSCHKGLSLRVVMKDYHLLLVIIIILLYYYYIIAHYVLLHFLYAFLAHP